MTGKSLALARAKQMRKAMPVLKSDWDEDKHPRDHGKFSSKPGADGASDQETPEGGKPRGPKRDGGSQEKPGKPAAPKTPHAAAIQKVIGEGLGADHLPAEAKAKFGKAVNQVMGRMPKAARERIAGVLKKAYFFATNDEMMSYLSNRKGAIPPGSTPGAKFGGMYLRLQRTGEEKGEIVLDGGGGKNRTINEIYAHEFTHAIDSPSHAFSGSEAWQAAHRAEAAKIGKYATTKPSESFAEFGRLVYGAGVSHKELKEKFPLSYAVFAENNLLPAEPKQPMPASSVKEVFSRSIESGPLHVDVLRPQAAPKKNSLIGGLAKIGKEAIGKAGHLEHAAKEAIVKQVGRLPTPIRMPVVGVFKAAFASYTAAQSAVAAVAKERGLDQAHIEKVSKLCAAADLIGGGKILPGVLAASGLGALSTAGSFVPVGSLAYLAYSTAKDPMATLRAAKAGVKAAMKKVRLSKSAKPSKDGEALISLLADRAGSLGEGFDSWTAAFLVAMDKTKGDHELAAKVADQATGEAGAAGLTGKSLALARIAQMKSALPRLRI